MKTINKIKTKIMKNKLLVIVMAIMLMPAISSAQDVFAKYNDRFFTSIRKVFYQLC